MLKVRKSIRAGGEVFIFRFRYFLSRNFRFFNASYESPKFDFLNGNFEFIKSKFRLS